MHDIASNFKNHIFSEFSVPEERLMRDLNTLAGKVKHLKGLGLKIVLTSGSYDILHIGHARYLEQAKKRGDVLIVGIDSDEKTRERKGPHRPVVSQDERVEMLCHTRYVDLVIVKENGWEKQALIKTVAPDVLILTAETYTDEQVKKLEEMCGEVVVLPPQAQTSTTAKIRRLLMDGLDRVKKKLSDAIPGLLDKAITDSLNEYEKPPKEDEPA